MKAAGITRNLSCAFQAIKDLFALVGATVILGVLFLTFREPIERALPTVPAALAESLGSSAEGMTLPVAETPREREQRAVTEFIAKRYRVADDAIAGFVATAYSAGDEQRVDPLLILAVMAIESRYNPVAESVAGARGLMQIIPRYHLDKLEPHGGEPVLLHPEVNIQVGAQILREYQRRFADTETALQMYAGALDEPTSRYANKVFAEKALLEALRIKARKPQSAQSA